MKKNWEIKPAIDSSKVRELAEQLNIGVSLANLLIQRDIDTFDKAKSYFRPSLDELHDPFLMEDMSKAVSRLTSAIEKNEKVLIYGDYDVDGTTSVSLMYSVLKHFSQHLDFYIPDRYDEGYGISTKGIDYALDNGFKLIIALDCGIRAIDKVEYANSKNIDFIICDHHNPGGSIPNAIAVLDPKRNDCSYPFKELSGCGVGFKLLQGYFLKNDIDETILFEFLDFLAVSIAADIVPIVGENRILAYHGLKLINENKRVSFKALKHVAGFEKELSITNVVFGFAPRINAAGRINHAKDAVNLLICEDEKEAVEFAKIVNEANDERKELDKKMEEEALSMIEENNVETKSTVLFKKDWHKGVVGIVASRCIEKHYKPTIILTESNGKAVGSARSVSGFSVYDALLASEEYIEQFGGHKYAAGMTISLDKIDLFKAKFEEVVAKSITEKQLTPSLSIDGELSLDEVSSKLYDILKQMAPFGPGNMTPIFISKGVVDTGGSRIVGETKEHLRITIKQDNSPTITGIAFGMADKIEIVKNKPFNVCYSIVLNEFRGRHTVQLMIRDIKST